MIWGIRSGSVSLWIIKWTDSVPNGLHHTVLPICWSLALKCTCRHAGACGGVLYHCTPMDQTSTWWSRFSSYLFLWPTTNFATMPPLKNNYIISLLSMNEWHIHFLRTLQKNQIKTAELTVKATSKRITKHKVKCHELCTQFKWLFITLMDLLGRRILFLFSNESVQEPDRGHKEWHIYLQARWFDKDRLGELLQYTGGELHWKLGFTRCFRSTSQCTLGNGQRTVMFVFTTRDENHIVQQLINLKKLVKNSCIGRSELFIHCAFLYSLSTFFHSYI